MTGEKAHAEFGASSAYRWLSCPASVSLSKEAPIQIESTYAKEGTLAHSVLELFLKYDSKTATAKALKIKADRDMIMHALGASLWIKGRAEESSGTLLCEQKVDASSFTCADQFGTLDAAIIDEFGTLVVIDYKYGAGIAVDPAGEAGKGNPQLVYYALAVAHEYDYNFSDVELVVIQPRAYHESGETIRTFKLSITELMAWAPIFKGGVKRAKRKDAFLASGTWCKFCPAATICPELKDKAFKKAQLAFSDTTGIKELPAPETLPLPNLGTILDACEKLEMWTEKVREHAMHMLERGHDIEGFKLVEKRGLRKWIDEKETSEEAMGMFGPSAFTSPELLSPAQLEKKLGKLHEGWVDARVTIKSSGTTLVRESDKRPAVRPIEEIFALPPSEGN